MIIRERRTVLAFHMLYHWHCVVTVTVHRQLAITGTATHAPSPRLSHLSVIRTSKLQFTPVSPLSFLQCCIIILCATPSVCIRLVWSRLVFKCGSPHLNANANAQNDSNANANANAQHFNQMQMQMQVRSI